jgi:hypothetical protein
VGRRVRLAPLAAPGSRRADDAGPALLSFVFVAIVVTGMIFSDYDFTGWADPALDRGRLTLRAGTTLAGALGPAALPHWRLVAGVIAGLLVLTVLMLVPAGRRVRDVERYRVLGLACVLAGSALAVMMSAGGFGALLLCVVFIAWALYGWPLSSVAVQVALLAAAVTVVPANARAIAAERATTLRPLDALGHDIAAGIPRRELAERYRPALLPDGTVAELSAGMAMVAGAGIGPLAALPRDRRPRRQPARGASARQIHPSMNARPPSGATAPSHRTPVTASR